MRVSPIARSNFGVGRAPRLSSVLCENLGNGAGAPCAFNDLGRTEIDELRCLCDQGTIRDGVRIRPRPFLGKLEIYYTIDFLTVAHFLAECLSRV